MGTPPPPSSNGPPIKVQTRGPVAEITLDRPPLNVLDLAGLTALNRVLARLRRSPSVQVVLFLGAGERAFSAGVAVEDHAPDRIGGLLDAVEQQFEHLLTLDAVTLAAIHGWTLGGGAELALLCDFVLAADDARIGLPEVTVGALPPIAAAWLPLVVGYHRAAEMVLRGHALTARRAHEVGLVSEVVPPFRLEARARALAAELAGHSATAQRAAHRALRAGLLPAARTAFAEALRIYREDLADSADAAEGVAAFVEKRPPRFHRRVAT
jgi:cyclohexa-1,5-dienecarbonyl-CoA hydratase